MILTKFSSVVFLLWTTITEESCVSVQKGPESDGFPPLSYGLEFNEKLFPTVIYREKRLKYADSSDGAEFV